MKKYLLIFGLFIGFSMLGTTQELDTLLFKNKWIILTEQEFIKENQIPTQSKVKYEMMKNAVMDTDTNLFATAILYRFLDMLPEEIERDPFNEIIIIDINKDGKNDVVFYLSPKWDAYSSVFWVFMYDGNKYHEYLTSSGIITGIEFDENGYKRHFTYFGKCCTYPYQIRSVFERHSFDSVTQVTYQTLSSSHPEQFGEIISVTLKKDTEQIESSDEVDVLREGREIIKAGTEIEVLGEENGAWFVKWPSDKSKTGYYLVWIKKQD